MADFRPIRVMISSRSNAPAFGSPTRKLADLRRDIKAALETEKLCGEALFEVWINEDAVAAEGSRDCWEESLAQVRRNDIVLALYNGEAGWALDGGEVGICHEEMAATLEQAPDKLYIVQLEPLAVPAAGPEGERDQRFRAYVKRSNRFHGRGATNETEALAECRRTLREAVAVMVGHGVREVSRGRLYAGEALEWSRMDFAARKAAMERTLAAALGARTGAAPVADHPGAVVLPIAGRPVLLRCHGLPAAFSVAAARELVGQPFLRDHADAALLAATSAAGPVHLIAGHRGFTEAQAAKMLGFSDATIVSPPFGVWAADDVQKVQIVLLANCRDDTATRHNLQRFFVWLAETGEGERLVARAASRARIVAAVAAEQAAGLPPRRGRRP